MIESTGDLAHTRGCSSLIAFNIYLQNVNLEITFYRKCKQYNITTCQKLFFVSFPSLSYSCYLFFPLSFFIFLVFSFHFVPSFFHVSYFVSLSFLLFFFCLSILLYSYTVSCLCLYIKPYIKGIISDSNNIFL